MRSYNINKRSVYAFRRLGKGYAGMKTFLTIMNLPPTAVMAGNGTF